MSNSPTYLRRFRLPASLSLLLICMGFAVVWRGAGVLAGPPGACARPEPGSAVQQPRELRSQNGELQVDLAIHDQQQPDGSVRYCYTMPDGTPSPTLRLHPGDLLILHFKNDLVAIGQTAAAGNKTQPGAGPIPAPICRVGERADRGKTEPIMEVSSNVHFHGLTVSPGYHQDDVLTTLVQPDEPPFEYRVRIPDDEPPGLYWYHPHVHGYSTDQVLGGASGALIIEGIERANPALAGLPERVLVIRDQELLNPHAPPAQSEPVVGRNLVENDGDAVNTGTGFGKPAKDLSINFVPVPYPDYPPAAIAMKPNERQVWRVLNASAITYLNLAVLFGHTPQPLGIVAIDGVPINISGPEAPSMQQVDHIGIPPGGRVEFIVNGPPEGVPALLVTRTVDTGPGGENDPNRALASIVAEPGCGGTGFPPAIQSHAAGSAGAAVHWHCRTNAGAQAVLFGKVGRSQRSCQRLGILPDRGRQDAENVRSNLNRAGHRGQARRGRGLDHRKPLDGTAQFPHPSVAFSARRLERHSGQRAVHAGYHQCPVLQRTHAGIPQRAGSDGLPRSEHRRPVCLSLPRPRS